jgi:circadian clock protein KaiC
LLQLAPDPTRLPAVVATLLQELRALGVTSLFTAETHDAFGQFGTQAIPGLQHGNLSGITDNIVVMRLIEQRSSLVRMISVLKARNAPMDPRLRVFEIGVGGIAITPGFGDPDAPQTGFVPNPSQRNI